MAKVRGGIDEIDARFQTIQEILQSRVVQAIEGVLIQLAAHEIKNQEKLN